MSSSRIIPALEQLSDLPAGDRALLAGQCPGLLECLARVPDPRDRRGVRHSLTSLLLAAVAPGLAGARSFTAIGEWVADAPPQVLAALGVRRDPLAGRFQPPDEATIRRVLEAVDAVALDAAVGSWMNARLRLRTAGLGREHGRRRRRAVAVDGKAVRGTRHASGDGQAVHLLAALDQRAGAVLAQAGVDGKTNEITAFAPLLEPLDLVRAENPVHGSDQQGCLPGRLTVTINGHVPAVRFPPHHAGGLMAAAVPASGGMEDRRDLDPVSPARRPATAAAAPPAPDLGGPGLDSGPARRDPESAATRAAAAGHPGHDPALAPRHRPAPLGHQIQAPQDWPPGDPPERQGPGPPATVLQPARSARVTPR